MQSAASVHKTLAPTPKAEACITKSQDTEHRSTFDNFYNLTPQCSFSSAAHAVYTGADLSKASLPENVAAAQVALDCTGNGRGGMLFLS